MSTINQLILESHVQAAINAVSTSTSFDDLLLLGAAIGQGDYTSAVNNLTELPDLIIGATPPGTHIFVTSIDQMAIAGVDKWYSLDGKILRYDSSGQLWTWGGNTNGQLGDNSTISRSSPGTTAGGGTNWNMVSGSIFSDFAAAIKTDGTLWTWGYNGYGQLGENSITNRSSPGTTAGGGTNWSMVSGVFHTVAIKTDGTLWTWGYNNFGQLGDNSVTSRRSPVTTAGGGTNWNMVSGGTYHTAAIKTDGTLWTWGNNGYSRLGNGSSGAGTSRSSPFTIAGGGTTWSMVSCGAEHTAAIKIDGTLWTWGYNYYGRLGDGTIIARSSPVTTAGGGTNWSMVSSCYRHTAAIKTDGTLWTWGRNNYGQLGNNSTANRSSPVTTAGGGTNWSMIGGGYKQMTAIIQL